MNTMVRRHPAEQGVGPKASLEPHAQKLAARMFAFVCFSQVVMGYAHSMIIARQDTPAEQERLQKLPEYNPRTI